MKKIVVLLAITIALVASWWPFQFLSIDNTYDFFPLGPSNLDHYPTSWYVFFMSNYATLVILGNIVHRLVPNKLKTLTMIFQIFVILRMIIFMLYSSGTIIVYPLTVGLLIYILLNYKKY
jgi:hypothetical protein